jgi:hypothetical protein
VGEGSGAAALCGRIRREPERTVLHALVRDPSLHADVHLHANDREGLEHLCCSGARGPLSLQRLSLTPDGRFQSDPEIA